jgi:DnaK suppressor protein
MLSRKFITERKQVLQKKLRDYLKILSLNDDIVHRSLKEDAFPMVKDALARIESGEYGICIDCGEDICPERLKLIAAAARCAHCQEVAEKKYAA